MIDKIPLEKILFLDIETVPQVGSFSEFDEVSKVLFLKKNSTLLNKLIEEDKNDEKSNEQILDEVFHRMGGIQAEFGKIICISVGILANNQIRLKSFYNDDEETLLKQFSQLLNDSSKYAILCGHNAKEFDFPYICRRMLIHGLKLPEQLNIAGKKPWEINHLDTLELWKFGDYKAFTSLALLCHVFQVPTPKDDISGADVARVYYQNDKGEYKSGLERIKIYCEKDVLALIQLLRKMKGEKLISDDQIFYS